MLALRIIGIVICAFIAVLLFLKNIGIYDEDKAVIIFTIIDWCMIAFLIICLWLL